MSKFFSWVGARLAEPSTHAALAAMAAASIPLFGKYGAMATGFFGAIGFGMAEKS